MREPIRTKVVIMNQGAPLVNDAVIHYSAKDIVCIKVDLKSKWCEIDAETDNGIWIGATKRSTGTKPRVSKDYGTKIALPEFSFKTWEIFSIDVRRYTVNVCGAFHYSCRIKNKY